MNPVLVSFLGLLALLWAGKSVRRVPTGHVGLVYRRIGMRRPDDRFRVRIHGAIGRQATILKADHVYFRPFPLFRVKYVKQTYVPPGTFGVVVAKEGAPPPDRPLCEHVDSDHFQDGRAFLANGGQMGRQAAVLQGGALYDINPWIFDVITTENIGWGKHDLVADHLKEIAVREGSTGVVIALDGNEPGEGENAVGPRVAGHLSFRRPWVFLANGGQRGAQEETLSHGVYAINPWFARVVFMPTRELILEWGSKDDRPASNYDAALGKITVNIEGHRLNTTMSQTIRIPERSAPWLVGRFGESEREVLGVGRGLDLGPVQRFVKRVLGRTVEGFFHNTASEYQVLDFLENHNDVCIALESKVRQALAEWDVEAIRVTMNEFQPEDGQLDQFRRSLVEARDYRRYLAAQKENISIEEEVEKVRTAIARERKKLGTAELESEVQLLGQERVAFERLVARMADMKVPEFIGSDAGALWNMPLPAIGRLIDKYFTGDGAGALFQGEGPESLPADRSEARSVQEPGAAGPKRASRVRVNSGDDRPAGTGGAAPEGGRVRGLEKFREQRESGGPKRSGTDDA